MTQEILEEKITKILNYKTYSDKRKIDSLLEIDADLYTNLGLESTKEERQEVEKNSLTIYRAIKKVNWETGCALLLSMGKLM